MENHSRSRKSTGALSSHFNQISSKSEHFRPYRYWCQEQAVVLQSCHPLQITGSFICLMLSYYSDRSFGQCICLSDQCLSICRENCPRMLASCLPHFHSRVIHKHTETNVKAKRGLIQKVQSSSFSFTFSSNYNSSYVNNEKKQQVFFVSVRRSG